MTALKIREIITAIEEFCPAALQESWDNAGLLVGNPESEIRSAVIALDVTEAVVDDAIQHGDGLIIAHHPVIFGGLKRLTGKTESERVVIKAIQYNIGIYAAHTNIDVIENGVSWRMAQKLALLNIRTLVPQKGLLKKLVTFVPSSHSQIVRQAIFEAGAGHLGNYDCCSYNIEGQGTFRAGEHTNPFTGLKGELHFEEEVRIETIFPAFIQHKVLGALMKAHPYEEVAYDIYTLDNEHNTVGLGVIGQLESPVDSTEFLNKVKEVFGCEVIKHTSICKPTISKVALVGGAGSSFLKQAVAAGADLFISGDFKYHQFFEAESKIIIADIGHYESEQFTKELFYEIVINKFSKFALRLSEVKTNPINYLF